MNGTFNPMYSSNLIYRDDDDTRCITLDLESIESDVIALETGKANASHTHTDYALLNHEHANYASSNHTHSQYAAASDVVSLQNLVGDTAVSTQISSAISSKSDVNHIHTEYAPVSLVSERFEITLTEEETKVASIYSAMSNETTKRVCAIVNGGVWFWDFFRATANYGCVVAYKYGAYGNIAIKTKNILNGNISQWAYLNPDCSAGIEYRTIEFWNGQPIYTKLVDCGTSVASSTKEVDVSFGSRVIRWSGCIDVYALPYHPLNADTTYGVRVGISPSKIKIWSGSSMGNKQVYIQAWYVK